jgi:universal stress protein A
MQPYQTILVAVDFSAPSQQALVRAKQLADCYGAELHVLHVTEVPTYPVLEDIAITGLPGIWSDDIAGKVMSAATQRLHKMAEAAEVDKAACQVVVGIAKQDIILQAQALNADLIVLGRHGTSLIQKLIGSTTDSIIHHAPCDVLAVNLEEKV